MAVRRASSEITRDGALTVLHSFSGRDGSQTDFRISLGGVGAGRRVLVHLAAPVSWIIWAGGGVQVQGSECYSTRNATMGSIREALRAGR
jgi:hypothetical protein